MRLIPGLFLALCSFSAFAQYPVSIRLRPPVSIDEEQRVTWTVVITNRTDAPIEKLHFYFSSTLAGVVEAPPECDARGDCDVALPAKATREFHFTTLERSIAPYGHAQAVAEASGMALVAYDQAVFGREYLVTSTADSGPGTLRQAILDINRECTGPGAPACEARFAIDGPVPASGWFTIALHSPLPEIIASEAVIDGGTQSRHTGETNPFGGPEVLLDGRAAGEGNGLTFRNRARVTDMAIGGFTGNGIESHGSWAMFHRNYIGVDPAGRTALPNGSRGIFHDGGTAYVVDNVLSGNGRSGAFFWTSSDVKAYGNFIGVGADGVTPLGNGASGLFFHKPKVSHWPSTASENVIAYNRHAGIGLSLAATGAFGWNTFHHNGAGAIDVGLDGLTPLKQGLPGQGGVVGVPTVTSARFENGVTTVTVRLAPSASSVSSHTLVLLYAGSGDTQELVANVPNPRSGELTITVPRDLRGQAVRATTFTNHIYNWDDPAPGTSEMSAPRVVE